MASEQAKRDNVVKEREVEVEKDKVPKITSHFESIAEKSKDSQESKEGTTGKEEEEGKASLEDIQGYRANAQQKSMDTIRAAEERYNKAKDSLNRGGQERETGVHGFQGEKAQHAQLLAAGGAEFKEREGQEPAGGRSATDTVAEKAREAKESVGQGAQKAAEMGREKGEAVKDTASEKGQEAKETMVEGGKGVAHYAGVAADKAAVAGWTAAHYTTEKVVQGTKVVAGTVEDAVDLTKEKAAAAADTVLEYTARKRDEAQHKNQETHQGGEEEKRQGVDTEPKRGFEERRQEGVITEPKRGFEEKRQGVDTGPKRGFEEKRQGVDTEPKRDFGEKHGEEKERERDVSGEPRRAQGKEYGGGRGSEEDVLGYGTKGMVGEEGAESGGVLEAIGETIVEIAQTTKNIVIGDNTPERNT